MQSNGIMNSSGIIPWIAGNQKESDSAFISEVYIYKIEYIKPVKWPVYLSLTLESWYWIAPAF